MLIIKDKRALQEAVNELKLGNKSIGFVPTMGALHQGHLSLVEKAKVENDVVVCSVFVNPTQFNDKVDFANYPRTEQEDTDLLKNNGCSILYLPTVEDIYEGEEDFNLDLKGLDNTLEGSYRPGHFDGVVRVVKRFFEIVNPTKSYFGLKDYQQFLIIKELANSFGLGGEIIGCETFRESSGLAMSSRNQLLTSEEKRIAQEIFKSFSNIKNQANSVSILKLIEIEKERLSKWFLIDYFEARDSKNLKEINSETLQSGRLFFAGKIGKVRLIDNIGIFN